MIMACKMILFLLFLVPKLVKALTFTLSSFNNSSGIIFFTLKLVPPSVKDYTLTRTIPENVEINDDRKRLLDKIQYLLIVYYKI